MYGFDGEQTDSSGLIYLRARYYSDGRFLSKDTWRGEPNSPMTYNAWLYVYANPVNKTDHTGRYPDCSEDKYQRADLTQWFIDELNADRKGWIASLIRSNMQHWEDPTLGGNPISGATAYFLFYDVVQTHGVWDFKWKINSQIGPNIRMAGNWYCSDVTGNISYGYIGMSVGFD
jgi:RHS repeat-associated protein